MKELINKDQLFGFIRHGLTVLGGALVTKGYIDSDIFSEVIGIIMAIAGLAWSVKAKMGSKKSK